MSEIFDKAREYARRPMVMQDFHTVSRELKLGGKVGEWRLHQQAFKLFKLAEERCIEYRRQEPQTCPLTVGEVIEELNLMQAKYAYGWEHEGKWHIKDYRSPADLTDTLTFFKRMGVHYVRQDDNNLEEAVHLRVSDKDFDRIFNPLADAAREDYRRLR